MSLMYEPVIGLEIHAQISTKTKMFCSCSTDSFGKQPNTNVCPICMGMPGMLPAINKEAVTKGIKAALALNCSIPHFSKFDRKNYFYPDLPKGFQISQYDKPISMNGIVDIGSKKIGITRLHLEDDAGKLTHTQAGTLCDYNRSGSPLMEIVSEPDMRSVEEASAYAQEIRRIVRYVGSSDCDMEKGMMRFDLNISLRPTGTEKFGTKVEIKNLNSFKALEAAARYEIKRQTECLQNGAPIAQETRGWDDAHGITISQRSKEEAHDYRYFPEPDLPPLTFSDEEIEELRTAIPQLPKVRRERFVTEYGLSNEDALFIAEEPYRANYFETVVRVSNDPKKAASFITTILYKHLKKDHRELEDCKIKPEDLGQLIIMVNEEKVSNNQAKSEVFERMYATGEDPQAVILSLGISVISGTEAIESLCKAIIEKNPVPVADFRAGKQAVLGFLVGQVMKESKGKAQPQIVTKLLQDLLQ